MKHALSFLLALAFLASLPAAVQAGENPQDGSDDARWLPWIGCWEGAEVEGAQDQEVLLVCFRYLSGEDDVEILTYADGELLATEVVRADGTPGATAEGGCEGERWADWSADGWRVFLHSEMACGEGVTRTTRGVMSILPDGNSWVEIHGVRSGGAEPLLGVRVFRPATSATLAEHGVPDPSQGREMAVRTARASAGVPMEPAGVAEAVAEVGSAVTRALLVERSDTFDLNAHVVRDLAERGVPGEVLDLMVALSYPDRFQIEPESREVRPEARTATRPAEDARSPWFGTRRGWSYSPWGMWRYDPYLLGYGTFGYGSFGFPGYRPPRIVVVQPSTARERSVTVDPDRGYVRGNRSGSSSSNPRISIPTRTSPPSASAGSGSRVTSQGQRSGSSDNRRRAVRRGSGGGNGGGGGGGGGGG